MKILFLYSELAGYFLNCIHELKAQYACDVTLIHYPLSPDAPFEFETQGIRALPYHSFSAEELYAFCMQLNPTIVYVSGWTNKHYIKIAKALRQKGSIVIGGMDNPWRGTLRQRIASLAARYYIKPSFNYIWVAGRKQYEYARHLGFSSEKILTGLYAADVNKFNRIVHSTFEKKLVFVGRFEKIKGVHLLLEAFKSLNSEERNNWQLIMIGNGSLKNKIITSSHIEIHDFMQPDALIDFVANAGGFILPSLNEPWGVVVQEFAAAGKPLLLSDGVNSGEKYLIPNYNGFLFKRNDVNDLRSTLVNFFALNTEEREKMGQRSYDLALQGDPKIWAAILTSVLHVKNTGIYSNLEVKS